MMELSIIPCGRRKIWDEKPSLTSVYAKDAYIGTLHKRTREYAEIFTDQWIILSAKHGFMFANDIVDGPYDIAFDQKSSEIISYSDLIRQAQAKGLYDYDRLIILAGKKYKPVINNVFSDDIPKLFPLMSYSGIGFMLQALNQAIETNKSIH